MEKKIAITVTTLNALESNIDQRFGRSPAFLILNSDGEIVEGITNPSVDSGHGAGTGSSALMAEMGVTDIISGTFGPKAFSALDTMNIAMWTIEDGYTAKEAFQKFNSGQLTQMTIQKF
ncbi:MAG: NifB/NifX family molybdenum-iron cluster-binding protein [Deltaproteobacteria bacterium]|nr:NifB/NifX family molybdenum-iron cluster-binding protein [Deltaproteobacteria bacterium]